MAQSTKALFQEGKFHEVIEKSVAKKDLNAQQSYYTGLAYYRLENVEKAMAYLLEAEKKGFTSDELYYYLAVGHHRINKTNQAIEYYGKAIGVDPKNQKLVGGLALALFENQQYDTALVVALQAQKLTYYNGLPFFLVPKIQQSLHQVDSAVAGYHRAMNIIDNEDPYYYKTLVNLALLEHKVNENLPIACEIYEKAIAADSSNHQLYELLLQVYYTDSNYYRGDSLFDELKKAYANGHLTDKYQKYGAIVIDQFDWEEAKVSVYKIFKRGRLPGDLIYKVIVFNHKENKIALTIGVEIVRGKKQEWNYQLFTADNNDVISHYDVFWEAKEVSYKDFREKMMQVLKKEISPIVSSE